jgi:hypothetical protein
LSHTDGQTDGDGASSRSLHLLLRTRPTQWLFIQTVGNNNGRAVTQAVSHRVLTAGAQVRAQISLCGIYGGQSGTGTDFSRSPSVCPCRYCNVFSDYTVGSLFKTQGGFIPHYYN